MENVFPYKEGVDYSRMRMTPEGLYSVTRRRDSEHIIGFLRSKITDISNLCITDATACVGGDTVHFSCHFRKVDSIEWKHDNFVVLRNNVEVFGAKNIILHEGDATRIFNWKTDVLYIDPPWGGPDYYKHSYVDLFMGSYRLDNWIEEILNRKEYPKYIVLKVPQNYTFSRLHFLPHVESTHVYRIRRFAIILLCTAL